MGEHEEWTHPSGLHQNGLLSNDTSSVICVLDSERWVKAEVRIVDLIACIQPSQPSEERQNAVADYVQRSIMKCFPCQADVCRAYQVLKKGGLKDENFVIFMYDDIAHDEENPRPGVIINSPYGDNVYVGVPKDYTGENVTVNNFFTALLGKWKQTAVTGGSGNVVNNGPNDHILIYYTDHGGVLELDKIDDYVLKVRSSGPAVRVMTVRVVVTQKLREKILSIAVVQLID